MPPLLQPSAEQHRELLPPARAPLRTGIGHLSGVAVVVQVHRAELRLQSGGDVAIVRADESLLHRLLLPLHPAIGLAVLASVLRLRRDSCPHTNKQLVIISHCCNLQATSGPPTVRDDGTRKRTCVAYTKKPSLSLDAAPLRHPPSQPYRRDDLTRYFTGHTTEGKSMLVAAACHVHKGDMHFHVDKMVRERKGCSQAP
ncbi:hypothetical protein GW17_00023061 [Ensete ventricosum]|nr:hypothetical protein GW17_00023061 [Ensete ventricosum]RZR86837.1 hypothetical protein BHM03_00014118 [Ensete ventricosum]